MVQDFSTLRSGWREAGPPHLQLQQIKLSVPPEKWWQCREPLLTGFEDGFAESPHLWSSQLSRFVTSHQCWVSSAAPEGVILSEHHCAALMGEPSANFCA